MGSGSVSVIARAPAALGSPFSGTVAASLGAQGRLPKNEEDIQIKFPKKNDPQ